MNFIIILGYTLYLSFPHVFVHTMFFLGCLQEDKSLHDCPQHSFHLLHFHYFINLGDADAYFLENSSEDVQNSEQDVLNCFYNA